MLIFKYLLEAKTHGRRFRGMIWEQNIGALNTDQTLVWFVGEEQGFRRLTNAYSTLMSWADAHPNTIWPQNVVFSHLYPGKHLKGF